jgi:hypothetical protein
VGKWCSTKVWDMATYNGRLRTNNFTPLLHKDCEAAFVAEMYAEHHRFTNQKIST